MSDIVGRLQDLGLSRRPVHKTHDATSDDDLEPWVQADHIFCPALDGFFGIRHLQLPGLFRWTMVRRLIEPYS